MRDLPANSQRQQEQVPHRLRLVSRLRISRLQIIILFTTLYTANRILQRQRRRIRPPSRQQRCPLRGLSPRALQIRAPARRSGDAIDSLLVARRGLGADRGTVAAAVIDEELHALGELRLRPCARGTLVRAIGGLAVMQTIACIRCARSGRRHGCLGATLVVERKAASRQWRPGS